MIEVLTQAAMRKGNKPHMKVERPCPPLDSNGTPPPPLPEDEWMTWTYNDTLAEVRAAAKGMIKLGFKRYDTVNIWGYNAPEWILAFYAGQFAGGKAGGIYPTDTEDAVAYKIVHSGGAIIVVEDEPKIAKIVKGLAARNDPEPSSVKAIVAYGFEPDKNKTVNIKGCGEVPVISWKALTDMGKAESDAEMEARIKAITPADCSTLIYTSGTTGDPKAVMIHHDAIGWCSNCTQNMMCKSAGMGTGGQERGLSYLPLSHIAGMTCDIVGPVSVASFYPGWCTIFFARAYDLKVGAIKDRLSVAKPTLFLGVPLVWEKIGDKIRAIGAKNKGFAKKLGDWAKGVNLEYSTGRQLGGKPGTAMGYGVSKAIMKKVKTALGFQELKIALTGAAPIRKETQEYYGSLDLIINEAYGMSECCGATTMSIPTCFQWGSCGFAMSGAEVKAFICDDLDFNKKKEAPRSPGLDCIEEQYQGELCYRGRHIMMGYMAQPKLGEAHVKEIQKKNAETIDGEGWLHSGDKGMITVDGMVKITGRYKEIIIGEGGENIAPVPIEDHVKNTCDGINEVMMFGDKRKYNVALVTLKAVGANGETPGTDALDMGALKVNPDVKTISAAMKDKVWIDTVTKAIESANKNGKVCINNSFKIQKFTILPHNFSEEKNELTPTKKLKRGVVAKSYEKVIEKMYSASGVYIEFEA